MEYHLTADEPSDHVAGVRQIAGQQCRPLCNLSVLGPVGIRVFFGRDQSRDDLIGWERGYIYEGQRAEVPVFIFAERIRAD